MRLPPAPVEGPDADTDAVARIEELRSGEISTLYRLLLHAGELAPAWCELGTAIRWGSSLDERTRELVTCLVASRCEADYEWANHAPLAERAGVTSEQLASLPDWRAGGFEAPDAAALRFADAVVEGQMVDEVFEETQRVFGQQGVVELAATVAYYVGVSRFLDALGVDASDVE